MGTLHQMDEELLLGTRQAASAARHKNVARQGQDMMGLSPQVEESRERAVENGMDFVNRKVRVSLTLILPPLRMFAAARNARLSGRIVGCQPHPPPPQREHHL